MLVHPGFAGLGSRHCLQFPFSETFLANQLTTGERRALKARAHALDPVVRIGNEGLTAAVLTEIGRGLDAHELIKIRAASGGRDEREAWLRDICAQTGSHVIQHIGKILVIYRQRTEPALKSRPRPRRKPRRPLKRSFQNRA
jgi:putative YhbY family RNA-binding protein